MKMTVKKAVGALLLLFAFTTIIFLSIPATSDESLWEKARQMHTESGYHRYLSVYPDGLHATEATQAWDQLSWDRAQERGAAHYYEIYLGSHPEGKHAAEARDRVETLYIEGLRSTDGTLRKEAAEGIEATGSPRYVEALVEALDDEEKSIREAVVNALVAIGQPSVEPLIAAMEDQLDAGLVEAARALGLIGDSRACEPLSRFLEGEEGRIFVKEAAAVALGKIGGKCALDILIKSLEDPRNQIYTVQGLAASGSVALDHLIAALGDSSWRIRAGVAEALGQIKDPRSVDALLECLLDDDTTVQLGAIKALAEIGDPKAADSLIRTYYESSAPSESDWVFRKSAAKGLGKIALGRTSSTRRVCQVLLKAMEAGDLPTVAGAHEYFIALGRSDSVEILVAALVVRGDKDMAVNFLNCGNRELEKAGSEWAKRHGYTIYRPPGSSNSPKWGRTP